MKEILKKDLLKIINEQAEDDFNDHNDDYDDNNNDEILAKTNWKDDIEPNSKGVKWNKTGREISLRGHRVARTLFDSQTGEEVPVIYTKDITIQEWSEKFPNVFNELKKIYGQDLHWDQSIMPKYHPRRLNNVLNPVFGNGGVRNVSTKVPFETIMANSKMNTRILYDFLRNDIGERSNFKEVFDSLVIPRINVERAFRNRHIGKLNDFNITFQTHGFLNFGKQTPTLDDNGQLTQNEFVENIPGGIEQYIELMAKKMSDIETSEKDTRHTARQYNRTYRNWARSKNSLERILRPDNNLTRKGKTHVYGLNYLGIENENNTMSMFDELSIIGRITRNGQIVGNNLDWFLSEIGLSSNDVNEQQQEAYRELANGSTDYKFKFVIEFRIKHGEKNESDPQIGNYTDEKLYRKEGSINLNKDTFTDISQRHGYGSNIVLVQRCIMKNPDVVSLLTELLNDIKEEISTFELSDMLMKINIPVQGEITEENINRLIKSIIKEQLNY